MTTQRVLTQIPVAGGAIKLILVEASEGEFLDVRLWREAGDGAPFPTEEGVEIPLSLEVIEKLGGTAWLLLERDRIVKAAQEVIRSAADVSKQC